MKLKTLTAVAILAAGAAAAFTSSSRAALTYSAGDLFLGFRGTGATNNYLINLGNIAQFSQQNGASFTVNVGGSIGADLVSAFGANWNTSSTVSWGAIGTTYNGSATSTETIFATRGRNPLSINTQTSPIFGQSPSAQSGITSDINALALKFITDGTETATSTRATLQTASQANTWASFTLNSTDFNLGVNVDGATFSNTAPRLGTATSVLDLYRVDPVSGQAGIYLGRFSINDSGVITFTAVPEPATYALLIGAGFLAFMVQRARRRSSVHPS